MTDRGRTEAAFRERFGRPPDGVWLAPGRVNLIGEHTDYNEGFVLPIALHLGVQAAVGRRDDAVLRIGSCQEDAIATVPGDRLVPGGVRGWPAYVAGVAWALSGSGLPEGGYDILLDGDLPAGAGLSSSAAVECAVGLALVQISGMRIDRETLARLAQKAENDFVGVPSGIMDQYASLMCTAGHAMLLDTRSLEHEQIPLSLEEGGVSLLVIDTGVSRRLAAGEYADRRRACQEACRLLGVRALRDITLETLGDALDHLPGERLRRRLRHVVTENHRVLQAVAVLRSGGGLVELGALLTASHASLRDDYEVSSRELDVAVDTALAAGAAGARLTGAGFGGCAIALVPSHLQNVVVEAVASAFRRHQFRPPAWFRAIPSSGARRIDGHG